MTAVCPIDGLPMNRGVCPVHGLHPPTPLPREHSHPLETKTLTAALGGDVALTNADTWYDGPSVDLAAGTWLVLGAALLGLSGTAARYQARITDGTNHYASGEGTPTTSNGVIAIHLSAVVVLSTPTTVKIQGCSGGAARTMYAATTQTATSPNATYINAVKLA